MYTCKGYSISKGFAVQAWGPESYSPNPRLISRHGGTCLSSHSWWGRNGPAAWVLLASRLTYLVSYKSKERSWLTKQSGQYQNDPWLASDFPCTHTLPKYMCACAQTHTMVHVLGPYDTMLPPIADLGFCCSLGTWTRCLLNLVNCATDCSPLHLLSLCFLSQRREPQQKS